MHDLSSSDHRTSMALLSREIKLLFAQHTGHSTESSVAEQGSPCIASKLYVPYPLICSVSPSSDMHLPQSAIEADFHRPKLKNDLHDTQL